MYCNYSKDKFGNEVTFIIPCWLDLPYEGEYKWHCWCDMDTYGPAESCFNSEQDYQERKNTDFDLDSPEGLFLSTLHSSQFVYNKLITRGWAPQQARAVLPNSLKTELVMTGFVDDWKHFFELRCAESAHPQARELAVPLQEEFKHRGLIK